MKRLAYFLLLTACVLGLTVPAFAIPNPTVLCQGNVCGGGGLRNYYYDISVLPEEKFTSFGIGVHDPVLANYANMVTPVGWSVTINELDPNKPQWTMPDDPFTAHGLNTGGPSGLCPYTLFWWDPIGMGLQQANLRVRQPEQPARRRMGREWYPRELGNAGRNRRRTGALAGTRAGLAAGPGIRPARPGGHGN